MQDVIMVGFSFGLDFLKLRLLPGLRAPVIRFIVDSDRLKSLKKLVLREAEFEPKKYSVELFCDVLDCVNPIKGCIRIFFAMTDFISSKFWSLNH